MRFKEFLHSEKKSELLVVTFKNSPSKEAPKLLFEELAFIEEGKTKEWGNGYSYRLDRRPDHMGGDQLHVFGRKAKHGHTDILAIEVNLININLVPQTPS